MRELDVASLRAAFECVAEDLSRGSSLDDAVRHAVRRVSLRQTQQILERLSVNPIHLLQSLPLPRTTLDFLAPRAGSEVTDWALFFRQLAERTTDHPRWAWLMFEREYDLLRYASKGLLQAGICCLPVVEPVTDGRMFHLAPADTKMTDLHRCLIDAIHYRFQLRRVVRVILRCADCEQWMAEKAIPPNNRGVRRYRTRCIRRWEAFLHKGRPLPPELPQQVPPPTPDFDEPRPLDPDFQKVVDNQPL